MRNLALGDVSEDDLRLMLEENETLFVEHKSSVEGEGYKIAEAVASFANTLGGWVLVGVRAGKPTGWTPPESLTDRVRQILNVHLDPLPAFAARVVNHGSDNIGLIRVYESSDTPHVLRDGKVVVRSVAEVKNQTRVYRAGGVDTQLALRQLADRGRQALEEAWTKLGPGVTPLIEGALGMSSDYGALRLTSNHVAVRAAPLAGDRLHDLAVSRAGLRILESAVRDPAGYAGDADSRLLPRASGLVCELEQSSGLLSGMAPVPRTAVVAADAAGAVAAALRFHQNMQATPLALSLNEVRGGIIAPLVNATVKVLSEAELFGRSVFELRFGSIGHSVRLQASQHSELPTNLPLGGEISLPLSGDGEEAERLADQWRDDVGRQAGFATLRS